MMGNGFSMGFTGGYMWLIWIALIVLLVWVVVTLLGRAGGGTGSKTALDILKERYARGEIDRQEFEQKRKDLQL